MVDLKPLGSKMYGFAIDLFKGGGGGGGCTCVGVRTTQKSNFIIAIMLSLS